MTTEQRATVRDGEEIWIEPRMWLADPPTSTRSRTRSRSSTTDCHAEVCARNEWVPEYEGDEPDAGLRGGERAVIARVRHAPDCADAK